MKALILVGGFGTLAMVALGCTVCHACQLDTCHVGIATQIETTEQAMTHGLKRFVPRDPEAGVLNAVNSSVGVWRKLDRIRQNPRIALVYHTRTHGFSDRPEYVLVQGTATLAAPDPHYPKTIQATWERFGGPVDTHTVHGGPTGTLAPEHAARYIAKYATKSAEDFGLGDRRTSPAPLPPQPSAALPTRGCLRRRHAPGTAAPSIETDRPLPCAPLLRHPAPPNTTCRPSP